MDEGGERMRTKTRMKGMNKTKGKKSKKNSNNPRQIPAFGNWDMAIANDLPITQYFESALQAGLVRYSSSSSFSADPPPPPIHHSSHFHQGQDYGNVGENRKTQTNTNLTDGGRKQAGNNGKIFDVTVTELPPLATADVKRRQPGAVKKVQQQTQYQQHRRAPKAVDEDLYKIPPELIKRKRRLGFFSRCLVPSCSV